MKNQIVDSDLWQHVRLAEKRHAHNNIYIYRYLCPLQRRRRFCIQARAKIAIVDLTPTDGLSTRIVTVSSVQVFLAVYFLSFTFDFGGLHSLIGSGTSVPETQ